MVFPKHIFRSYDIRGFVDGELSEELAYGIGKAFVLFLQNRGVDTVGKSLVVGQDMRESSPAFAQEVIRGITERGVSVVDIGLVSTPLFNFACASDDRYVGGIMVTASHNPAEYNGFKLTMGNGLPVGGQNGMDELRDLVEHSSDHNNEKIEKGIVIKRDIFSLYKERLFSFVETKDLQPLRIVIDAGNGMGKVTFPKWLSELPVEAEYLFLEPDGNFPNHEANPLKTETLVDLQQKVKETGADFGFALDGDCDRIGLVDEKGAVVEPSSVGALIGLEVLKKHPQATMLYDLRSSRIVEEVWVAAGAGRIEKTMVGHANIKKHMKEVGAVFASELSLHLYFGDLYDLESSDLCLLYLLSIISREKKPLSELVQPFAKYVHSGEINFTVKDTETVMKKIEDTFGKGVLETLRFDGLWMRFDWGFVSVRKSNTEPVLRLNLEAKTKEDMEKRLEEISSFLTS